MITIYTEQDNGNLKLVAELEGIEGPALAVDALLDEMPRLKDREFVVLSGNLDDGAITRVVVEDDEPIQPRRKMRVASNGEAPVAKRRGRPPGSGKAKAAPAADETGEEAPAPKRRGRPPGSKNKPKTAVTTKAKPGPKPKAAAGKAKSPFKKDDE